MKTKKIEVNKRERERMNIKSHCFLNQQKKKEKSSRYNKFALFFSLSIFLMKKISKRENL
jgi:hypothetical protein